MSFLFDGTNHPTAQQVINAGCSGCLMYGGTPQYSKNLTAGQYADYKSRGLLTPIVFEIDANDMNGGAGAGAAHAQALLADLRSKGVSDTEPVGATVDKHITAANIPLAVKYQRGFAQAVWGSGWRGAVGAYGFAEFLIAVHNEALAEWYWGAGQRSLLPPYTNVWQDNTGTIIVGGSIDDKDWILIPIPQGDIMEWTDQLAFNQTPTNPTRTAPAGQLLANADLYAGNAMNAVLDPVSGLAALHAQISALAGTLSTSEAAILAAVANVDSNQKNAFAQMATAIAAVQPGIPPTDAQVADIKASFAAALQTDISNITLTFGTKP